MKSRGFSLGLTDAPGAWWPIVSAPAPEHLRAAALGVGSQFLGGARLADARLTHQHDQPALARKGVIQGRH